MRQIRQKTLWLINLLLTTVIGWLASCAVNKKVETQSTQSTDQVEVAREDMHNRVMVKYGVPNANYHLYGRVNDINKHGVADAEVIVKGYKNQVIATTTTDKCGKYVLDANGWPTDTLNVVVNSEQMQISDSVQVEAEYQEKDGWTREGKKQKINIQLTVQ